MYTDAAKKRLTEFMLQIKVEHTYLNCSDLLYGTDRKVHTRAYHLVIYAS